MKKFNAHLSTYSFVASIYRCIITVYAMLSFSISIAIIISFIAAVFTAAIAKKCGVKHSVYTINGTDIILRPSQEAGWEFIYFHVPLILLNAVIGNPITAFGVSMIIETLCEYIVLRRKARRIEGGEN